MAEPLSPAAVGFSSHSGWVAVVCVARRHSAVTVIERSRWLLTTAPLPREPFHDAKRRPDEAEGIVAAAAEEARALAFAAISGLRASARAQGYDLVAAGVVLGEGSPAVTLSQALSTHASMHGAEGWLFREALMDASQISGLKSLGVPERELPVRAAAALAVSENAVGELLGDLGRRQGPPWGRDQKAALMAALEALHSLSVETPRP